MEGGHQSLRKGWQDEWEQTDWEFCLVGVKGEACFSSCLHTLSLALFLTWQMGWGGSIVC